MNERFNRAVTALYTAFHENTLVSGNCTCCAVGNIVAAGLGYNQKSLVKNSGKLHVVSAWSHFFLTEQDGSQHLADDDHIISQQEAGRYRQVKIDPECNIDRTILAHAKRAVRVTGYSKEELARVEYAFERSVSSSMTKDQKEEYAKSYNIEDKDALIEYLNTDYVRDAHFKGLCAVVSVLCDIEGIDNVMDYQALFEYDEDRQPVNQLTDVLYS